MGIDHGLFLKLHILVSGIGIAEVADPHPGENIVIEHLQRILRNEDAIPITAVDIRKSLHRLVDTGEEGETGGHQEKSQNNDALFPVFFPDKKGDAQKQKGNGQGNNTAA